MMFDNNKAQETTVPTPLPTGEGSGVGFFILLHKKSGNRNHFCSRPCVFPDFKKLTILN